MAWNIIIIYKWIIFHKYLKPKFYLKIDTDLKTKPF